MEVTRQRQLIQAMVAQTQAVEVHHQTNIHPITQETILKVDHQEVLLGRLTATVILLVVIHLQHMVDPVDLEDLEDLHQTLWLLHQAVILILEDLDQEDQEGGQG